MPSVDKIFSILDKIVEHQEIGLSCSQISRLCSLPKSSTHRTLTALLNSGYVNYDRDTQKYSGSLKLSNLGSKVIQEINLRRIVRPYLLKLNQKTNYTCHLVVKSGTSGVYLDKIETGFYGIKLFSEIGKSFPLHCTASGKIFLAFLDPQSRSDLLKDKLPALTPNTITNRTVLEKQFQIIKQKGYAIEREETTLGILCIATPILNAKDEVIAAISLTFPTFLEKENGLESAIESIIKCCQDISQFFKENILVSNKISDEIFGITAEK